MSTPLRIRLLGDLQVLRDDRPLDLPQSRKTRALLGYLVVTGAPERRETLCDLFWDGPSDPRAALRWSLTKLRELVDDEETRIAADRERVAFEARGAQVDLHDIRERLAGGVQHASLDDLRTAASALSGELLAGLDLPDSYAYSAWLAGARDALRRSRREVLDALVTRLRDRPDDALAFARQRIAIDPFDDDAHASVIELLGALGRVREAMDAYDECRRVLKRELGREPSASVERARMRAEGGAVAASSSVAAPTTASSAKRPPFVGRQTELARLDGLLDDDSSGARVLLVTGEPGIGKSRLVEEFCARAARRGGMVLWGRAFEAEMIRPYGPWIDALQSLFGGAASRAARPALDAASASALSMLVPGLTPTARATDVTIDRSRLFAAVFDLLQTLARDAGPIVVALDDLQWFDDASLALLHYVARSARSASEGMTRRIVLALTARKPELEAHAPAVTVVRTLRRDSALLEIALGPLPSDDVAALAGFVDGSVDAARVAAASEGNPLFALEVARNLASGNAGVPATLEAIIDERLAKLSPAARDIVTWAAALGGSFTPRVLAQVGSFDDTVLLAALEELERGGIICPGTSGVAYDFSHDLIRHVSYHRMPAPRAAAVHLTMARRLDALDDPRSERSSDVAAHAMLGGEFALAAQAFARAADRSIRVFALVEAAAQARRGLAALDLGVAQASIGRAEQVELAVRLYNALVHAGGARGSKRDVQTALERLAADARALSLHAHAQTAFYLISYIHFEGGEWSLAEADTRRAVEAGRAAGDETALRSVANSGRCLAAIERDLPLAGALLAEATQVAGSLGVELVDIPWGLGILAHYTGRLDDAVSHLERAVVLGRARDEHWPVCDCLIRLASIELERGRYDRTRAYCDALAPVAVKLGDASERPLGDALAALASLRASGDVPLTEAELRLESAIEELTVLDAKGARSYVLVSAADWHWSHGRVDQAVNLAREALAASRAVGRRSESAMARVLIARAELMAGHETEAAELVAAVESDALIPHALSARAISWSESLRVERPLSSHGGR